MIRYGRYGLYRSYLLLVDPARFGRLGFNTDVVILALLHTSSLLESARPQAKSFTSAHGAHIECSGLVANAQLLHTCEDAL